MSNKTFAFATVKAIADGNNPNGEFEVILSTPTLDRDGEVIEAKAFEPLPDHITFDIDHGLSTATTVGSGKPFYDGNDLKVTGEFSSIPRAQEVRTLVAEGHIRTASVAFMDAKRDPEDKTHIVKAELLNGAFVPVPSNRDAVILVAKAYEHEQKESSQDPEPQTAAEVEEEIATDTNPENDEAAPANADAANTVQAQLVVARAIAESASVYV